MEDSSALLRRVEEEPDIGRVTRRSFSQIFIQFPASAYVSLYPVPKIGVSTVEDVNRQSELVTEEPFRRSQ